MTIAIDLIESFIQFRIVAPATKGLFQVGQSIDADLDLYLRPVWKKDGFLKFDRGSVNFSFQDFFHQRVSCDTPYRIDRGLAKKEDTKSRKMVSASMKLRLDSRLHGNDRVGSGGGEMKDVKIRTR